LPKPVSVIPLQELDKHVREVWESILFQVVSPLQSGLEINFTQKGNVPEAVIDLLVRANIFKYFLFFPTSLLPPSLVIPYFLKVG
jgi:hypothetical protein